MVEPGPRVGLVLGGGGVLGGAWEAGALQAIILETGWDAGFRYGSRARRTSWR